MKILLVAIEEYLGQLDAGTIHTLLPLKEMGHDVLLFDYFKNTSADFVEKCRQFNPDLVFYCLHEKEIRIEDMLFIKDELKINSLLFNVDSVWRYQTYYKEFARGVNYVVDTSLDYVNKYRNDFHNLKGAMHCTLFANDKVFFPIGYDKIYDVSFVGRSHGGRIELIKYLGEKGIDIKVFENVSFNDMNKIYNQSKLVLSPSMSSDNINKQDKLRFYEITASSVAMLSDYDFDSNSGSFENHREFIKYDSKEGLITKINYYLANDVERIGIAKRGYERFKKEHTSKIKLQKILEFCK